MLHVGVHVRVHPNSFRGCLLSSLPRNRPLETESREQICLPTTLIAIPRGAADQNIVFLPDEDVYKRQDLDSAFGDWESIRAHVHELTANAPARIDTDVLAALRSAERDPAGCSDDEYLALATADGPALEAVTALADSLRRDVVGDDVTFVVNRNINFTNICYTGCRFCAFAQRKGDADAFSLSAAEVAERAWEAHVQGATEVCMQLSLIHI